MPLKIPHIRPLRIRKRRLHLRPVARPLGPIRREDAVPDQRAHDRIPRPARGIALRVERQQGAHVGRVDGVERGAAERARREGRAVRVVQRPHPAQEAPFFHPLLRGAQPVQPQRVAVRVSCCGLAAVLPGELGAAQMRADGAEQVLSHGGEEAAQQGEGWGWNVHFWRGNKKLLMYSVRRRSKVQAQAP